MAAEACGPRRAVRIARRLLALLLGLLVAVGLAEGLVRANPHWMPQRAQLRVHWREIEAQGAHSVRHPECGFTYRPSHAGEIARRDFRFAYTTDAHGFRNREPLPERAPIVALGDSMTFGYGVDDEQTWTALLEAAGAGPIVNLALPGYGPEQYARAYELFGAGYAAERVLVGVLPANDVRDAELFARWLERGGRGNYDLWRFAGGSSGLRGLLQRSYLATWVEESVKIARSAGWYTSRTLELEGGGRVNLVPSLVASASRKAEPGNPSFELVLEALDRLVRHVRADGARELLVLFPSKEEVYLPTIGADTPEPVRAFVDAFAERGWETLDLTAPFRAAAERGEQVFFEVDGHPNAAGYALVAEAVREALGS